MSSNKDGIDISYNDLNSDPNDSGRMTYRQIGTVTYNRGYRIDVSFLEHKMPEGTRGIYIKELVTAS